MQKLFQYNAVSSTTAFWDIFHGVNNEVCSILGYAVIRLTRASRVIFQKTTTFLNPVEVCM
jgi:hypothetical protein